MKSVMSHDFARIPRSEIQVSKFDRSHGLKTTLDSGYLVPIYLDEVLPGDTFDMRATMMAKMLSPMVSAPMDNIFLDTQWFYVPSRLIWTNFTKMMGERRNPRDNIDFLVPTITAPSEGFAVQSLADYFGIPPNTGFLEVNALPFRAYAKIWDDWYRAEQLQDSIIQKTEEDLGDGNPNNIQWNKLLKRGKRHDYFTSALPTPQLGTAVEIPLGDFAPVVGTNQPITLTDGTRQFYMRSGVVADGRGLAIGTPQGSVGASANYPSDYKQGFNVGLSKTSSGIVADLSDATAISINMLRQAFQIQKMLEKDSRGGTRYTEIIRTHFNTICPDARLQRSEYLGGSSQLINITQHFQESATNDVTPQGNRIGTAQVITDCKWSKSFTEHGYIIGLASIRVDLNYQQGVNRLFSRRSRYDFYWPTLSHLGEQPVLRKEIFANGTELDNLVFGYQERYAEYRYHPSLITGKLRSRVNGSLDVWHLAQYFDEAPTLSPDFIEENPPLERVLSVQNEPQFIFDGYFDLKCTRPMPLYAVPSLVDHF